MTAQKSSFCATSAGPRWRDGAGGGAEVRGVGLVEEAVHGERAGEGGCRLRKVRRSLEIIERTVGAEGVKTQIPLLRKGWGGGSHVTT